MEISCATCRSSLTAAEAIAMAEQALEAGRMQAAICYVNVAYAIFDTAFRPRIEAETERQDLP